MFTFSSDVCFYFIVDDIYAIFRYDILDDLIYFSCCEFYAVMYQELFLMIMNFFMLYVFGLSDYCHILCEFFGLIVTNILCEYTFSFVLSVFNHFLFLFFL
jgi:hypothetical protein